jgi:hypothetical protein
VSCGSQISTARRATSARVSGSGSVGIGPGGYPALVIVDR